MTGGHVQVGEEASLETREIAAAVNAAGPSGFEEWLTIEGNYVFEESVRELEAEEVLAHTFLAREILPTKRMTERRQ